MREKTVLNLDTSNNKKIMVAFDIDGKHYQKISQSRVKKAQAVLPLIDELLRDKKIKLSQITAINVNPGPGSFTGLRVGVAVANALGWALDIPVNGKKNKPVIPIYK